MATVIKRKGSPFYYARFQINGQDFTLTTGKKKRGEALDKMKRMVQEKRGDVTLEDLFDNLLQELERHPQQV